MRSPAPAKPATPGNGSSLRARARLPGGMTTVPIRVWGAGNMSVVTMVPAGMAAAATPPAICDGSVTGLRGTAGGRAVWGRRRPWATAAGPVVPAWTAAEA